MKSRADELLYLLLWSADRLLRPSFRNLTDSYEAWSYRNGLHQQLGRLEARELLKCKREPGGDRLYRLTERGRLHALGGRDPVAQWSRPWDGRWYLVIFDVPTAKKLHRNWLRRYLRAHRYGLLQGSVWITPDPPQGERALLKGGTMNVKSLILFEARPCSGETDEEIVAGAWDFESINRRYTTYLEVLEAQPDASLATEIGAKNQLRWAHEEREAWNRALEIDPLLPDCLLPRDYLGQKAWQRRVEALRRGRKLLATFPG